MSRLPAIVFVVFVTSSPSPAQTPPTINAIVSSANFLPPIAPNGLGTVFGANLSDGIYTATTLPLPTLLGPTQLLACLIPFAISQCNPIQLLYADPMQINFLVPSKSGLIVARVNSVLDQAAAGASPFPVQYAIAAPTIFWMGYDCYIDARYNDANQACGLTITKGPYARAVRGAITDQTGRLLDSANPAKLGNYYTIWLTGMGKTQPTLSIGQIPVYGYSGDTYMTVYPSYYGVSQFVGLDQINFQLPKQIATGDPAAGYPPSWPCGTYSWEVGIEVFENQENGFWQPSPVYIPIRVNPGDVPCS